MSNILNGLVDLSAFFAPYGESTCVRMDDGAIATLLVGDPQAGQVIVNINGLAYVLEEPLLHTCNYCDAYAVEMCDECGANLCIGHIHSADDTPYCSGCFWPTPQDACEDWNGEPGDPFNDQLRSVRFHVGEANMTAPLDEALNFLWALGKTYECIDSGVTPEHYRQHMASLDAQYGPVRCDDCGEPTLNAAEHRNGFTCTDCLGTFPQS